MKFPWTPENLDRLAKLRAKGLSQEKCAKILGCHPGAVFKALHPKQKSEPKPKLEPKRGVTTNLPRILHGSCPMRRRIDPVQRNAQPLTKNEMYDALATAVLNTARLSA
jgi:hypothetical protein